MTTTMIAISNSATTNTAMQRSQGRSMRTIRSNLSYSSQNPHTQPSEFSGILTDSFVDAKLGELAVANHYTSASSTSSQMEAELLEMSDYSDDSDVSGELQRIATAPVSNPSPPPRSAASSLDLDDLESLAFSSSSAENLENETLDDVEPLVIACVERLSSPFVDAKRSAAATVRSLAKHRSDFRALLGAFGAIPALVPLLRSADPAVQENAVTALLNLSLEETNRERVVDAGAIKPMVHALRTGTAIAKQNAACALLRLSMVEKHRATIGASGAIPPLVALLVGGTNRGKKDALTTLYKLCSTGRNMERAVCAGVVRHLVEMVGERDNGLSEKALVILGNLAEIEEGSKAIEECGGIDVLLEAIQIGTTRERDFCLNVLIKFCAENVRNRCLLVQKGVILPLVTLSQSSCARVKQKAESLVEILREDW